MTERTTTIKLSLEDQIGNRLLEIRKQRDALLARPSVKLNIDSDGISQAQRAMAQTRANALSATRDMSVLGDAVTSRAVAPMAQYSAMLGAVLLVTQKLGPGLVTALQRSNVEFTRQRDLMRFWGTSGYLSIGIDHFKSNLAGFVSTSGTGFTKWLQNTSAALAQYRTALAASAAVMVGMATAAALSSKSTQNYIQSTLDSRLMQRKLSDRAGAEKWIQSAEGTDWSAGRESRMGAFQTILSKNPYMGQTEAQKGTEDIEKFFFANQEMLKKKGYATAEALASAMSAQTLSGEDATKFEDIFGLGFGNLTPRARLGRVSTEAGKLDMVEEVGMRPEEILTKRFTATTRSMGDAVLPPLLAIMNMFVKLSDIVGKIPGLGGALGWAAVLTGIAAAGLTVISVLAGLIGPLGMVIGLIKGAHLATVAFTAAQWLLNVALTANPIGVAVVAIVALIGVLYLLEKRFGVVTKAWNALKAGMSSLGGAFKDAGGMGVLKIAVDAMVANNPMLKILLFQFDLLKKIWLGGETLNKIMGGAVTIWQSIGQFFSWIGDLVSSILDTMASLKEKIEGFLGGEEKKAAGALDESKIAADVEWAKSQRFDDGKRKFDVSDETLRAARVEAETGIAQPHAPMFKESDYTRIVDAFRGRIKSDYMESEKYKQSPIPDAIKAADKKINKISLEGQEKADEAIANRDFLGFMANQYSMGAQAIGAAAEGTFNWLTSAPSMDSGGSIIGSGGIIGHAGEEVSPASAVVGAKTTLERMSEAVEGGLQTYGQMRLSQIADGSTRMASRGTITLERMSEVVTILKKIWLGGETLNKIMGGVMASLTENIGGFLGNGEEKAPLSQPERDETIQWAKDLRKAGGAKRFDFGRESGIYELALKEAETGVAQDLPNMQEGGKAEYDRLVNSYRNLLANPNYAVTQAKTDPAAATGQVFDDVGIGGTAKIADAIASNSIVSKLSLLKEGYDYLFGPAMASGGTITGSGGIIGHAGEEVSPASAVVGAKTTLERMSEAAEGGRGGSITVGDTTININVDRIDSDIDLERALAKAGDEFDRQLMFKLRNLLDSGSLRGIGYLRG